MVETPEKLKLGIDAASIRVDAETVCRRVPPLWDLPNYVAVNPYLGFSNMPFEAAARIVADGLDAKPLPTFDDYRRMWLAGAFMLNDLDAAARRFDRDVDDLRSILSDAPPSTSLRVSAPVLTFAERHDAAHGTEWHDRTIRFLTRWCAVWASEGGETWRLRREGRSLFSAWREAANVDRSLEMMGLRGWRRWIQGTPQEPLEAIAATLARLDMGADERADYFYRLLRGVYGWASHLRRFAWQAGSEVADEAIDLLAARVCLDGAVAELAGGPRRPIPRRVEDESVRLALQEAWEDSVIRKLVAGLNPPISNGSASRPAVQAVFCIDVRSEPMRRHLEAQSPEIQTRGFAGFFGVSLDWRADDMPSARSPVLLKPALTLGPAVPPRRPTQVAPRMQAAPAGAFSYVEVLGLIYGVKLALDAASVGANADPETVAPFRLDDQVMPLASRVELAAGILKNLSLTRNFARLVVLCGHAGRSANNPHAAGLHCGACGGHGGALNARIAAALLNDPAVRRGLAERDLFVPNDTHFLAALHDTSTDEVTPLDLKDLPPTHLADVRELSVWLKAAGERVRRERAPALGLAAEPAEKLLGRLQRRARDWSETRPEWALARNAFFIAARRERTRGVDLEGRAFLHEYDAAADADGSVLTLILSAPMVVASWINLQYFASTVDNHVLGAGDKALHNRVGSIGVVLGNGGDLCTGLTLQSVHAPDGSWAHEPLRLQVIVEAERSRIDTILKAQKGVADLVDNGWVRLFALDPDGAGVSLRRRGGGWEAVSQ